MNYRVIISLVNWANWQDTCKVISQLKDFKTDFFQSIIIVNDNASPNNSYEKIKSAFPDLRIIKSNENYGFSSGHYQNYLVAKEMKADLFWVLNSDLEVQQDTLAELLKVWKMKGDHIYGSVSLNPLNSELIDFGGAKLSEQSYKELSYNNWKGRTLIDLQKQFPNQYEVESVEGSSMLVPMSVIEKYGFMKTDFFMYGEETDYCYRMRKFGVRSYVVTKSIVKHYNEGSTNYNPRLKVVPAYYRRRNALRFSIEHLGMSKYSALRYKNGTFQNLKTWMKGYFSKNKDLNYYYALACIHAFLGVKGRTILPEKYL